MKTFRFDCAGVRTALRAGRLGRHDESHLFRCAECRLEARIAAAWKTLPRPQSLEDVSPVEESFVRRVLIGVRADRRRQRRSRIGLAAAAAVLFFFAAAASQRVAAERATSAEETYSQLLTPSLDSFLPE
jgi:hypothetical protein